MTFAARFIGWVKSLFQAQRSLRFRLAALPYLSRLFAAGSTTAWTYSLWVKRGAFTSAAAQFLLSYDNSNRATIDAESTLTFECYNGPGADYYMVSTAVLRDMSAWYHLTFVWDSNNAVAADRMRMYINGVRVTAFTSGNAIPSGATSKINTAAIHNIGRTTLSGSHFDGYLAEVNFVDGQALTPLSFGQIDPITGQWSAKKYTGTFGTNGFYLPLNDTTSLTTLTADSSGNGNNWTANNISLTAGATYDSMLDVPLGGGGNERGNYATLNPLTAIAGAVSAANLSYTSTVTHGTILATQPALSGKTYWEATISSSSVAGGLGISVARNGMNSYPDGLVGLWWAYDNGSSFLLFDETTNTASGGGRFSISQVWKVAVDVAAGKAWLGYSLGWLDSANGLTGNPATGANPTFTFTPGTEVFPFFESAAVAWQVNYGQRPFNDTPPVGFKALHTGNLPDPVIQQPSKHVLARLRTGGGAPDSVSGLPLAPELIWVKGRSAATNHQLFDKVRGAFKSLASNSSAAEQDLGLAGIRSFNPDGYTMGNDTAINTNNAAYVDWLWKAGGAPVANNAGSIASQVSANSQAGFSIATYTGNSANATVGHGLGVTPKLVIVKARTGSATTWVVYHKDANASPASGYLALNDTIAFTANASVWGNVEPTPSNFSVSNNPLSNASGINYVAYCFAEIPGYSKIGRYTANASADGPFIHCGFRPRFVIIKRTDSTSEWRMYDSTRSDMNPVDDVLRAEQATAEGVSLSLDFTATGFKIRTTDANLNGGAAPYIFMAFAEAPLKYALAR